MHFSEDIRKSDLNKKIAAASLGGLSLAALSTTAVQAQTTAPNPVGDLATQVTQIEGAVTPIIGIAVASIAFLGGAMLFKRFIMS